MALQCVVCTCGAAGLDLSGGDCFWLSGAGGQFSVAALGLKALATTGRFFFSDGSSFESSAGLLTPPTPPTGDRQSRGAQKEQKWNRMTGRPMDR